MQLIVCSVLASSLLACLSYLYEGSSEINYLLLVTCFFFGLMHTIQITYKIIVHDIYTGKIYARDVTTGDQHPMRLTSKKIDTSTFKRYII